MAFFQSAVVGMLLCWRCGINNLYNKVIRQ